MKSALLIFLLGFFIGIFTWVYGPRSELNPLETFMKYGGYLAFFVLLIISFLIVFFQWKNQRYQFMIFDLPIIGMGISFGVSRVYYKIQSPTFFDMHDQILCISAIFVCINIFIGLGAIVALNDKNCAGLWRYVVLFTAVAFPVWIWNSYLTTMIFRF